MKTEQEMNAIISRLKALYPDAMCSLDYEKDYELLFSVRLAAQCTDARVNLVTPALFARFPRLEDYAVATPEEVGEYIRSCGFWRAKARDIVASSCSRALAVACLTTWTIFSACRVSDEKPPTSSSVTSTGRRAMSATRTVSASRGGSALRTAARTP